MSSVSFSALSASFLRFVSSRRSSDEEICLLAKDSRNYLRMVASAWSSPRLRRGCSRTNRLELVLPELLLLGLVEEGKVADVVDEDIAEDGQLRILGCYLAGVGSKGSAEALEGGGGCEL